MTRQQGGAQWLRDNVKIGNVHDRMKYANNAWHNPDTGKVWYDNGTFTGAYEGFVPVDDVLAELFYWDAIEVPGFFYLPCKPDDATDMDDAGQPTKRVQSKWKSIIRPDTGLEMGKFTDQYPIHNHGAWLVDEVANILDDSDIGIDSAGLLDGGARAWVCVSLPDEIIVNDTGFAIRPVILAVNSHNGSTASSYFTRELIAVCDNSLDVGLRGYGGGIKIKHTKNSTLRIGDAREALGLLFTATDGMKSEVDALIKWDVSNAEFAKVVEIIDPVPAAKTDAKGNVTNNRSINSVVRKRGELTTMWNSDPRVAPWQGTALGLVQAYNTHHLWVRNAKTGDDASNILARNFGEMVKGTQEHDSAVIDALCKVQGRDVTKVMVAA